MTANLDNPLCKLPSAAKHPDRINNALFQGASAILSCYWQILALRDSCALGASHLYIADLKTKSFNLTLPEGFARRGRAMLETTLRRSKHRDVWGARGFGGH